MALHIAKNDSLVVSVPDAGPRSRTGDAYAGDRQGLREVPAKDSGIRDSEARRLNEEVRMEAEGSRNGKKTVPRPETVARYREALDLYAATGMPAVRICEQCGVPLSGFRSYLQRFHRELLLERHGKECSAQQARQTRLAGKRGQTPAARAKYGDAIAACDDEAYLDLNVAQIARRFGLDGTALGNQLRQHYPEILERRERERRRRGLADNLHRGMRLWCREQYAGAVGLLRTTEMTVPEAAEACGVSVHGLSQHLLFYYKELLNERFGMREQAKDCKLKGRMTGNGQRHEPRPEVRERYREAERLYRETPLTIPEIADRLGMNRHTLSGYLQTWCRETVFARRGAEYREGASLSDTKHYLPSTAAKYAPAIERLRRSGLPTAKVASEFGLHPECFRAYLREHFPELHARQGMTRAANGRTVSRRSMEKYAEAIRLYETTDEDLKSIALRLGLTYNSLGGFLRRNFPELIARRGEAARKCLQKRENADSAPTDTDKPK